MGRASKEVRSKKTHALVSTGIRCASWGWDGRLPPRMDTVACRCAMSNYDNCACAGMLLLTHGTHHHPRRACARLAGARTTSGCLLPAVRWWRLRGCVRQQCPSGSATWTRESMLAAATARWPQSMSSILTLETRSRCSWSLRALVLVVPSCVYCATPCADCRP